MVDKRDEAYEGQEEGEYHFSDENTSYEIEPEVVAADSTRKTASAALKGFTRYRRTIVIGIIAFIALVAIYRMLMPGYTPQATDFTQTTPINGVQKPVQTVAASKQAAHPAVASATSPAQMSATQAVAAGQQGVSQGAPGSSATSTQQSPVAQGQTQPMTQTAQNGQTTSPATTEAPKTVNDRVALLEEQNAKLTNLLQIEYAQKISDYAAEEAAMQNKIQELNTRVAGMETVISQLNQLLQNNAQKAASAAPVTPAKSASPRMSYVVQAIIPGRAWLKSDSGDTITVAEGDSLKGYGRITKIDPYDGIVTVDTGSKTLTLSYGMSADS